MTSDEEKEKSISEIYEGETKQETKRIVKIMDETIEIPDEVIVTLPRAIQDTSGSAIQVAEIYGEALEPAQVRRLQEIARVPATIAGLPENEGWKLLAAYNREIRDILMERSAEERVRERKEDWKYWLAVGVAIAVGLLSVAVQVITWWLGR